MSTSTSPHATTGLAWRSWQDWVNVVLGVFFALTPLFMADISTVWAVALGIVIAVVALWALGTVSSAASEWVQVVAGALAFLSPWIGGFATGAAGWTAWILGLVVVALALWSMNAHKES